jgi:hypothetical protein
MSAQREDCVTLYLNVEIKRFLVFAPSALMRAGMPALPGEGRARMNTAIVG